MVWSAIVRAGGLPGRPAVGPPARRFGGKGAVLLKAALQHFVCGPVIGNVAFLYGSPAVSQGRANRMQKKIYVDKKTSNGAICRYGYCPKMIVYVIPKCL